MYHFQINIETIHPSFFFRLSEVASLNKEAQICLFPTALRPALGGAAGGVGDPKA